MLNRFTQQQQGLILMLAGVILLLHTLHILEKWLDNVIIVSAVVMIVYGAYRSNTWEWLQNKLRTKKMPPQ